MTTLLKDDLLDPEVNHDPYPFLARLRELLEQPEQLTQDA